MEDFEEKVFIARIADMAELCDRRGIVFTHFLNERQAFLAESELKKLGIENYCFYGGTDNAERVMLCVFNEYNRPERSDFPFTCVTFKYRKASALSHRDFLGSLTALNLKREAVGDILIGEGIAQVFVIDSVKKAIENDLRKIGSVGVEITVDTDPFLIKERSYHEIKGTSASMRLDCILSLSLGISRGKAAAVISSGTVEVNYKAVNSPAFNMKQGDIFSARGYGKFRVEEISGISKKGRLHIIVQKYC